MLFQLLFDDAIAKLVGRLRFDLVTLGFNFYPSWIFMFFICACPQLYVYHLGTITRIKIWKRGLRGCSILHKEMNRKQIYYIHSRRGKIRVLGENYTVWVENYTPSIIPFSLKFLLWVPPRTPPSHQAWLNAFREGIFFQVLKNTTMRYYNYWEIPCFSLGSSMIDKPGFKVC